MIAARRLVRAGARRAAVRQGGPAARRGATLLCLLLGLLAWSGRALGDLREEFETPQPAWRLGDTDCARITARRRVFGQAHRGEGCELIQLFCGQGSNAYLTYAIPRGRVIDELAAEMWVKSNRGGLQMMLRVVLPHSRNPHDGQPLTRLIPGSVYSTPGQWQRLTVESPATRLRQLIPSLRSQFGPDVTPREAYVDLVVLNAYGGPGLTNVFFDDLLVRSLVSDPVVAESPSPARTVGHAGSAAERSRSESAAPRVEVRGDLLMVEGRPFFPRVITWRGESFAYLRALGFNTVKLEATATPTQLAAALREKLWIICPPPELPEEGPLGPEYDRVLGWSIGRNLGPRELGETERFATRLRRADRPAARPLIASVHGAVATYSRLADIVLVEREPLSGSFPMSEFAPWLRRLRFEGPLGVPLWSTVQNQQAAELDRQLAAIQPRSTRESLPVDPRHIRMLAFTSLSAGARGLYFPSRTRLDGEDPVTRLRAKTLELLNLELQLVEPWIAGGMWDDLKLQAAGAQFGLWQSERSRLLIAVRQAENQQYVLPAPEERPLHADVYSVPVTDQAFQVTTNGLKTLRQRRGSGSRITIDEASLVSLVVLTENPLVVNHMSRFLVDNRMRQAQLEYEVAAEWLEMVEEVQQQLNGQSRTGAEDEGLLERARAQVIRSRRLLDGQDFQNARDLAQGACDDLAALRHRHWQQTLGGFDSPVSSPLCACYETVPLHWALLHRLRTARWSPNGLAGGDFENLEHMRRHGWSQQRHEPSGASVQVELTLDQPQQGRHALRLRSTPREDRAASWSVPPVVIESAPVPVRPGQLVRIQGWVFLPQPLEGHPDGLVIADSLGGAALAQRIHSADRWRSFTLYRAVPADQREVTVRFALHGFGDVRLDDLSISVLEPLAAR